MVRKEPIATKFEMSFKSSIQSRPNIISKLVEPEHLMIFPDAMKELLYRTARESTKILTQEAENLNAWMQDLENREYEDGNNVDEDIEIDDKRLEFDHE